MAVFAGVQAGHVARRRPDVDQKLPGVAASRLGALAPCLGRAAARWFAALCVAGSSAGCVLTQDLPDPALDIPQLYKPQGYEAATNQDAPPALDWWRGFRSREMTGLMEQAQRVNLDIAAAVARFIQADAQARITGAALLPSLNGLGSETYSRTSASSASGLSIGGRGVVNYSSSLRPTHELEFSGNNPRALPAAGRTPTAHPLRPRM